MPMRDWGGGGNLSGTFSALTDLFLSQVEGSKNRAIRQSKADAAAQDAETYDQWINGMLSDGEWLDYIQKRMEESKGEPEELQQWTEAYRKHSRAIADGQMESAYQEGSITIHDLIAHYSENLTGLERNSPEYRETSDRYWSLVDQRDADYIDEQSMVLVDKIERGQASYTDLLSLYQGMLGRIRSSSPLVMQIKRQITNIRQIVDGITGGRGGGSGGSRGGSGSGVSSSDFAQINATISDYYRTGNVFVPTGEAVVQSVFDRFNVENTKQSILDAMEADSRYIEQMMERWKANPDDPTLRTAFGQTFENSDEMRWAIHNQAIANYDQRVVMLNAFGDWDGAALVQGAREKYVEDIMQVDNGLRVEDYWAVKRETFNQSLNLAALAPDPDSALSLVARSGRSFARSADRLIRQSDAALPELKLDADTIGELQYARDFGTLVENARNMDVEQILTEASLLIDKRPDNFWLTEDKMAQIIGNTDGPSGSGIVGQAAARDGYQATLDIRAGRDTIVEPWVYVARAGESTPVLVKQSEAAAYLGISDGDWKAQTRPFAERTSLKEQPVIVYRQMQAYEPPKLLVDEKGRYITWEQQQKVGRDPFAIGENKWSYQEVPALVGWSTVTDQIGNTWYVDPADGQLYERLPFRAGINGSFDVQDLVDSGGKLNLQRVQGAEGLVMGVGPGVSLRWAQNLVMDAAVAGEIDMELYHPRDVGTGQVAFDPLSIESLQGMYWSAADAARERAYSRNHVEGLKRDATPWSTRNDQYRKEIAQRNEDRRVARVREWYDEKQFRANFRNAGADGLRNAPDDAIGRGARQAGVIIAQSHAQIDEPAIQRPVRLDAPVEVPRRSAPVSISAVRPPVQDPKITEALPSVRPVEPVERPAYVKPPTRVTRRPTQRVL